MLNFNRNRLFAIAAFVLSLLLAGCAGPALRVAPHAELKVLDPVWTTAYITRNHGHLVYDTLFALDENFEPQPQMVDTWTSSTDKRTWVYKLRNGLKWHDGTNVTAADCVASLKRWGKRDGAGQQLFNNISSLSAIDSKTIEIKLRESNPFVNDILAKTSSNVPFMMPKRIAQTSAYTAINDPIGSGPFIFKKDEWVPGKKVVYIKNESYVSRKEPQSMAAGGKVAKMDRIEWKFYPTQTAATNALINGEVDYLESPSTKLIPSLEGKKNIVVAFTDPLGNIAMARFNSLQPPFDNVKVRRAALMAMNQKEYMTAALGDQKYWKTCYSVYPCGTQFENETGNAVMKVADIAAAKKALKDANYDGTPVVILNPADIPVLDALTKVTADKLRSIGMTVNVKDMDWATMTKRRASRGSVNDGGWNMFHTWWIAADLADPNAIAFSGNRDTGWYGWPADAQLEQYRTAFAKSASRQERKEIAAKVQERLFAIGALGILGQFFEPVAYSSKVKGITTPVQFYWSMSFGSGK